MNNQAWFDATLVYRFNKLLWLRFVLVLNEHHYMTMVVAEVSLDMPVVNPLTPMSDQEKISLYNINTVLTRQVMRIKKKSIWG